MRINQGVVAVSQGGETVARSQPSDPIVDTTGVTGLYINLIFLVSLFDHYSPQFLNFPAMLQYWLMVTSQSPDPTSTLEDFL